MAPQRRCIRLSCKSPSTPGIQPTFDHTWPEGFLSRSIQLDPIWIFIKATPKYWNWKHEWNLNCWEPPRAAVEYFLYANSTNISIIFSYVLKLLAVAFPSSLWFKGIFLKDEKKKSRMIDFYLNPKSILLYLGFQQLLLGHLPDNLFFLFGFIAPFWLLYGGMELLLSTLLPDRSSWAKREWCQGQQTSRARRQERSSHLAACSRVPCHKGWNQYCS